MKYVSLLLLIAFSHAAPRVKNMLDGTKLRQFLLMNGALLGDGWTLDDYQNHMPAVKAVLKALLRAHDQVPIMKYWAVFKEFCGRDPSNPGALTNEDESVMKRSISSSLNGCTYVQYRGVYIYGPLAKSLNNVASSEQCANQCWKFRNGGTTRCAAANFLQQAKRCELLYEAFDVNNPGMFKYYGENNPDAVYLLSVSCDPEVACGRTLVDPMSSVASKQRIVGGTEAIPHSIPWIISLRRGYTDIKLHGCGGALLRINDDDETDIVITAAHCKESDFEEEDYAVVAGAHDLAETAEETQSAGVKKFVLHEEFNPTTNENDIAIIKLRTSVKFSSAIQPVCLPNAGDLLPDGTLGLVAGWGAVNAAHLVAFRFLQQLIVPIINIEECVSFFQANSNDMDGTPHPKFVHEKLMMCAGYPEGGKDSCQGDSGGPLTFKSSKGTYVLHGVVSFGTRCAEPGLTGVYTRVSSYVEWINNKIEELKSQ